MCNWAPAPEGHSAPQSLFWLLAGWGSLGLPPAYIAPDLETSCRMPEVKQTRDLGGSGGSLLILSAVVSLVGWWGQGWGSPSRSGPFFLGFRGGISCALHWNMKANTAITQAAAHGLPPGGTQLTRPRKWGRKPGRWDVHAGLGVQPFQSFCHCDRWELNSTWLFSLQPQPVHSTTLEHEFSQQLHKAMSQLRILHIGN